MPPRTSLPPVPHDYRWSSPPTVTSSTSCCGSPQRAAPRWRWPPTRPPPAPAGLPAPGGHRRGPGAGLPAGPAAPPAPVGPGRPVRANSTRRWEIAELIGAEHVAVLPAAEPWLVDRFAECAPARRPGRPRPARVAVIGGRGGAGASVLAGGLAVTAARAGLRTLLVDADPLGGGLDLVLGWEELDGLRWPALTERRRPGRRPRAWSGALPQPGRPGRPLLGPGRPAGPARRGDGGHRGRRPTRPRPRRGRPAAPARRRRRWSRLQAADQAFVVVPAELRATAAAARVVAAAGPHCATLSVIVRGPAPGRLERRGSPGRSGSRWPATCGPSRRCAEAWNAGEAPRPPGRGPLAAPLPPDCVTDLTGLPDGRVAA